jgi:hypothetical protein
VPPAATASVEGQSAIGATIAPGPPGGIAASCHLDFRLAAIPTSTLDEVPDHWIARGIARLAVGTTGQ